MYMCVLFVYTHMCVLYVYMCVLFVYTYMYVLYVYICVLFVYTYIHMCVLYVCVMCMCMCESVSVYDSVLTTVIMKKGSLLVLTHILIYHRPITKGEIGCFLSHYFIWEKVKLI